MNIQSIKEFVTSEGFTHIAPKVRTNVNGYPFLSFSKGSEVENIYFSKSSASDIDTDQIVTKEFLAQYSIAHTKNEAGEERIKLVSKRLALEGLLD